MKQFIMLVLVLALAASACDNTSTPTKITMEDMNGESPHTNTMTADENIKKATVLEALQAGTYTYVRLKSDGKEFWAAITARPVDTGKTYYYKESMLMRDFESKQLQRTFDSILFIESFSDHESQDMNVTGTTTARNHTTTDKEENLAVDHSGNELPLAELFSKKENYSGKEVNVKGKVVKINREIMGRNWVHIQDGSSFNDEFDLTITLTAPVDFAINDIVAFKGTITLDKDFGAGYVYSIIMEDAEVVK